MNEKNCFRDNDNGQIQYFSYLFIRLVLAFPMSHYVKSEINVHIEMI